MCEAERCVCVRACVSVCLHEALALCYQAAMPSAPSQSAFPCSFDSDSKPETDRLRGRDQIVWTTQMASTSRCYSSSPGLVLSMLTT